MGPTSSSLRSRLTPSVVHRLPPTATNRVVYALRASDNDCGARILRFEDVAIRRKRAFLNDRFAREWTRMLAARRSWGLLTTVAPVSEGSREPRIVGGMSFAHDNMGMADTVVISVWPYARVTHTRPQRWQWISLPSNSTTRVSSAAGISSSKVVVS